MQTGVRGDVQPSFLRFRNPFSKINWTSAPTDVSAFCADSFSMHHTSGGSPNSMVRHSKSAITSTLLAHNENADVAGLHRERPLRSAPQSPQLCPEDLYCLRLWWTHDANRRAV